MSGRKPFKELTKGWSKTRKAKVAAKAEALRMEYALADLRKSLNITQTELAHRLQRSQGAIAQMEGRDDMNVSNLRRIIEGLGGKLKISAEFPEGEVTLTGIGDQAAPQG